MIMLPRYLLSCEKIQAGARIGFKINVLTMICTLTVPMSKQFKSFSENTIKKLNMLTTGIVVIVVSKIPMLSTSLLHSLRL